MGRKHKPKSGSMQFWHRVRAKRIYPRIRSWLKTDEVKIQGFAGYKAGMTHILIKDTNPKSPTKGENVFIPITIIECPPLKPLSLRFYQNSTDGLKLKSEILAVKLDKTLNKKIKLPNKTKKTIKDIEKELDNFNLIRLLVYTQPKLTTIGKKKPEIFELSLGFGDVKSQFELGKSLLEKEIRISEVFKPGKFIDAHAVTTGKGLQGPVKRFGVSLKSHKSEKKRRAAGNLGPVRPSKVLHTVPQKGQMGFHVRTIYNNLILDINEDPSKINSKAGFRKYGVIKNDYLLIKGSIPGPKKRLIKLSESIRNKKEIQPQEIIFIKK